jgi:hypothetical protein
MRSALTGSSSNPLQHCAGNRLWPHWFGVALSVVAGSAQAHVFCVNSANAPADPQHGLRQALAAAADGGAYNAEDNTIRLVRGNYSVLPTSSQGFTFISTSGHKLDINGGYDADCSALIEDPTQTVLDGAGMYAVLVTSSTADVSLRWVTLQNGYLGLSDGGGLSAFLTSASSELILEYDIIRDNTVGLAGAGVIISGSGLIYIEDDLITGNSAGNVAALFIDTTGSTIYLINNTIAGNINTYMSTTSNVALDNGDANTVYASNNIFWGNTATADLDFSSVSNVNLVSNDYASINGTPDTDTNNQGIDPQFVGGGNYRLSVNSPLLNTGTLTPAGSAALPTIDIAGNPRSFNSTVDFGAYERGNEIFKCGFDQ